MHLFAMSSLLKSSQPPLKDKFIGCGLVLSRLWHDHDSAYANLCPPSLHIKNQANFVIWRVVHFETKEFIVSATTHTSGRMEIVQN